MQSSAAAPGKQGAPFGAHMELCRGGGALSHESPTPQQQGSLTSTKVWFACVVSPCARTENSYVPSGRPAKEAGEEQACGSRFEGGARPVLRCRAPYLMRRTALISQRSGFPVLSTLSQQEDAKL